MTNQWLQSTEGGWLVSSVCNMSLINSRAFTHWAEQTRLWLTLPWDNALHT